MKQPDLRQLRCFSQVARLLSVTAAAKALHVSQPAVSASLKLLESQLGVKLFVRSGRAIRLTAEGELLAERSRTVFAALDDVSRAMEEAGGTAHGTARIGVPPMFGGFYLPEKLLAFRKRFPEITISMQEAGARSLKSMLEEGVIDVAVIARDQTERVFEFVSLGVHKNVLCVAPAHPLAMRRFVRAEHLVDLPWAMLTHDFQQRLRIDELFAQLGRSPIIAFETNSLQLVRAAVARGGACALLPRVALHAIKGIAAVPTRPAMETEFGLAWVSRRVLSRSNQALVEFLKAVGTM